MKLKNLIDYENQYSEGLITRGEKYNKVVDAWSKCTDKVARKWWKNISYWKNRRGLKINSVLWWLIVEQEVQQLKWNN